MSETSTLRIAETASITGLSMHTLRYYERIGLLDPIERGSDGRRRFAQSDLAWLGFLTRLRTTGMPIRDMQEFADLRRLGDTTAAARLALLQRHSVDVRSRIAELTECLGALEDKIGHYRALVEPEQHRQP